jgi:hypothetical protein
MPTKQLPARLATRPEDYARLGLRPGMVELWEDGRRTDGRKGTYEWWYFDAHLDDGPKIVIVFYTKPLVDVAKGLAPQIALTLDWPDGTHIEKTIETPAAAYTASPDRCDVRIGPHFFSGDLHQYTIHVEAGDVLADLALTGTVPAWRPATGYLLFGAADEYYFAWLPAVPQGAVSGTLRVQGQEIAVTGNGYHDHNWGNRSMVQLLHHWYWARGQIGPYTLIASYITAEKRYSYQTFPVFMLAEGDRLIADDASKVQFAAREIATDATTGKPVANITTYDYRDGDARYHLTFTRRNTILRMKLVETIHGIRGRLARLVGFDGAFLRFTGDLDLRHYQGEQQVAHEKAEAIWEMMYFGHAERG